MLPDFLFLSSFIDSLSKFVNVRICIHVLPKRFSVLWIISSCVSLLTSIIIEWNTSSCQCEEKSIFEHCLITMLIQKSCIIVIVYENSESINVFEFALFFSKSIFDVLHWLTWSENIFDCEVHGIIEKSGHMVLVVTNIVWVTIKNFTHLKNASSLSIFTPKIFWNFWNCVNSDSIKSKSVNLLFNPSL